MSKRYVLGLLLAVAALALAAGCGGDEEAGEGEVTVELSEQSGSGQTGTATLVPEGEMTRVTIELSNPPGNAQPAHIHPGSCDELDPKPAYPLEDVTDGSSETTVEASVEELQDGDFAINVHESADEIETYVACGDVE